MTMYLPVVSIIITNSTWAKGVVGPGVGRVVRSIVPSTLIRPQVTGFQPRKIITIPFVVRRRRGSSRRIIAGEGTARIVRGGGEAMPLSLVNLNFVVTPPRLNALRVRKKCRRSLRLYDL